MAQLYNPPITQLLRSLLLQCVFLLGIVSMAVAQTSTVKYDGPWSNPTEAGLTTNRLSIDGAELSPSDKGGSAQLRVANESYVDIQLPVTAGGDQTTPFKVSYSLIASAIKSTFTAQVSVRYSTTGSNPEAYTNQVKLVNAPRREVLKDTVELPGNATNVRFILANVSEAYVLLDAIEVTQDPVISSFAPAGGVAGMSVTIKGWRLHEVSAVRFGNVEATGLTLNGNGAEVTATVPKGVQSSTITVITPYGQTKSATQFAVPDPIVGDFTPQGGAGDEITIKGQYFTDARGVAFNGVPAETSTITVVDDNTITVEVPVGASDGPITVVGVERRGASTTPFDVLAPTIVSFEPIAGGSVGTPVTINGQYLAAVTGVLFNGVAATFELNEAGEITTTAPIGAATGYITLKSPAGDAVSEKSFEVPAPTISSFEPTSAGPNMQITLTGTNLSGVEQVVFLRNESDEADNIVINVTDTPTEDTKLVVTIPVADFPTEGQMTSKIQVVAPGINSESKKTGTSVEEFTFVPAPTITTVETTKEDASYGYGLVSDVVTITGTNFETATSVIFGTKIIKPHDAENNSNGFKVVNGTTITFNIIDGYLSGAVSVTTLGGTATWDGPFDVVYAPKISSIAPTKGPIGREVTITGEFLKYASVVTFAGAEGSSIEVTELVSKTDSEIKVLVPENAVTGTLSVTNPVGTATSKEEYEVIVIPVIQAFTPEMGVQGDQVTITGYNFIKAGGVTVAFAGVPVPAEDVDVKSDTELTAVVPAGAVTGAITVTNQYGPGSSEDPFTIIALPAITSIDPDKGTVGNVVTITGSWFIGDGIAVTFLGENGQKDDSDIAVSAGLTINEAGTEIKVTVPKGATSGPLMVTNAAGNSNASVVYTVVTTPEITDFTPKEGKAGDKVTITGWLLDQATGVNFNGAVAEFEQSSTDGAIEATVPAEATTGKLSLVVDGEVVNTSEEIFTVIPAPTIVSFDPEQGVGGTLVTISGTNFEGLSKVTFLGTDAAGDEAEADLSALTPAELSTEFTIAVPNKAVTGKIQVTSAGGTVISDADFVVPVPANITFTPTTSYAGQEVVIRGQYFTNATEITFNGNPDPEKVIKGVTVGDEIEGSQDPERYQLITVIAPFDAGTGTVTVTTPAGTGTSEATYTVIEPKITSITSEDGAAKGYAGKTVATITGDNFTTYWNETTGAEDNKEPVVRFAGVASGQTVLATEIQSYSNTKIVVVVPEDARTGGVSVESGSGVSEPFQFEVLAPKITSVNPNIAYAGQLITVTGDNFIDLLSVTYNGDQIEMLNPVESKIGGSFQFIAPKAKVSPNSGTASLIVTTQSGSATVNFTVRKPIITSITRDREYAGIGRAIALAGSNFTNYYNGSVKTDGMPQVRFAGTVTDAEVFSSQDNSIFVRVPAGAQTGPVTVTTANGIGESGVFTVIGTPRIDSFSPLAGVVGTRVTINGDFFDEAVNVIFKGDESTVEDDITVSSGNFIKASNTSITLDVPSDAKTGKIAVTNLHGTEPQGVSSGVFRVVHAPVIAGFTPASGPAGTTVRITGENLWDLFGKGTPDGAIQVFFSGHGGSNIPTTTPKQLSATVTDYDILRGTWVEATVPTNAITGIITVTNEVSTATSGNAEFEVTSPQIVRFEREGGDKITSTNPVRILETVLIKGYSLEDVGTIKFTSAAGTQSISALSFWERDKYTLEVEVPRYAFPGPVEVTTLAGKTTSSADLYIAVPTITISTKSLTFTMEEGQVSEVKSYTVSAKNLAIGEDLSVFVERGANDFQISMSDAADATWDKSVPAFVPDESGNVAVKTIYVRNQTTAGAGTNQSGRVVNSSYGVTTEYVDLSAAVLPLPVELMSFNAALQNNNVLLTWATASEQNNSHFEVEMSKNPKSGFEKIGQVNSKGSNSMTRLDYEFTHRLGNLTGTIYYRLKQVDLDGTTDYSKVVAVNVKAREVLQQVLVAPNPINYNSKLFVSAEVSGKANLVVYSMTGKKVYAKVVELQEGPNEVQLPVYEKLNKGMYILSVELNGQVSQVKLVKE